MEPSTLHLTPEQRQQVISALIQSGNITTKRQRIDFLEATTLAYHAPDTAARIPIDGSAEEFARSLVREVEAKGIITMTRQPALILVLGYLWHTVRSPAEVVAFLEELLAPYQPLSPLFESRRGDIEILSNIWYSPRKFSFFEVRKYDIGTLEVQNGKIYYEGEHTPRLRVDEVKSVKHIRMDGSVNNNWVEVHYQHEGQEKVAYFAEASRLGVGELIGGSHRLFLTLRYMAIE